MTTVQKLVESLEAKERAIAIQNNKRSQLNSKLFFDARQMSLYPSANVITEAVSQETLAVTQPPENTTDIIANDDATVSLFESNIKRLSGNNASFLNTIMTHFDGDIEIMDFLNSSWADVKTKIKSQFKNSRVSAVSVILFLDKYVSKYRGTLTSSNLQNTGFNMIGNPNSNMSEDLNFNMSGNSNFNMSGNPHFNKSGQPKFNMSRAPSDSTYGDLVESDYGDYGPALPVADATRKYQKPTPIGEASIIAVKADRGKDRDVYDPEEAPRAGKRTNKWYNSRADYFKNLQASKPPVKISDYFKSAATDFGGNGIRKIRKIRKTVGRGSLQQNMSSKLYVDTKHLNNNKLAVKYKSTAKIIIKPTAINDKQKNVINSIIHNKFKQSDYDKLNTNERVIIDEFCLKSGVNCVKSLDDTGDKLFIKYEVLVGSINAGNDNPNIIQMLKDVVLELTKMKRISKVESVNILRQL